MIRVVVADDQTMVRQGLGALLNSQDDITVVGYAGDGHHAIELCGRERPDVVLMDVRMPRMDGLQATRRLLSAGRKHAPHVIMLTTFDLDEYVYEALRAGASGFLLKDLRVDDLVHAVRVVASGDALLAPTVTRRLIETFAAQRPPGRIAELAALTDRETEVLTLIARGRSNAEIARALAVADETVKTHVGRILTKLGLRDRVQAVVLAYDTGLVTPRHPEHPDTSL
jgi:DNA-binding NarL/FixJ family response regulator